MPSETLQSCIVNAATRLGTISTIASIDFQARRAHLVHDGRNLADICADRPQTSIKLMEAPAPISESSYILLVALSLPIETRLFRLRHRIAIRKRAQQIARMVTFISYNLQTKDYDRFVASFSNPWKEPDASKRQACQLCFQMRFSPTCWYDAVTQYPNGPVGTPYFYIRGGGDDWGVVISGSAKAKHRITVDLHVPEPSRPGPDARAIVRTLLAMPGWSKASDLERVLGMVD